MDWKDTVQKMIDHIESRLRQEGSVQEVARSVGYSPFYCSRAFSAVMGITLKDYSRLRRISSAAVELRDTSRRILDIAVDYGYSSQEAFTRAFIDAFDIAPGAYRRVKRPIPLFLPRPAEFNFHGKGEIVMQEKYLGAVKVTFVEKPARKMLVWHMEGAGDYHALCGSPGAAEAWGLLESMAGTLGGVIAAWIERGGETIYVWGVEFPAGWTGEVPQGFEVMEAQASRFVKFCHPPYAEEEHEPVVEAVWNRSETYDPASIDSEWADDMQPMYEDDRPDEGYMVLRPIRKKV